VRPVYQTRFYCSRCAQWWRRESLGEPPKCPRCHNRLRTKPKNSKYKRKYLEEWVRAA